MPIAFSVIERKRPNSKGTLKKQFYVRFYEKGNKENKKLVSINTIKEFLNVTQLITRRSEVKKYATIALEKGYKPLDKLNSETRIVLDDYLVEFWDFDTSEYITTKNKFKPNSVTKSTAKRNMELIKHHVILSDTNPIDSDGNKIGVYLPAGLKADELTVRHLDALAQSILFDRKLAPKTFNNVLAAINPALKELVRKDIIPFNPLDKVKKPTTSASETTIDAFTAEEIERICNCIMDNIDTKNGKEWLNHAFVIITAAATGMRQGEIISLQPKSIEMIEGTDYAAIHVERSHNEDDGFKLPKNGKMRWTYCDKRLAKLLIAMQPDTEGLIFKGHCNTKDDILGTKGLRKTLNDIINLLSISRNNGMRLEFHSLRHYVNTELNNRTSSDTVNKLLGHRTTSMNDRYNHPDINTMKAYSAICGSLLPESVLKRIEEYYHRKYDK